MTVGADGLAYAKVGYSRAKVSNYRTLTYRFTGYSIGFGYKQFFNADWYGFVEANYASYGDETETAYHPYFLNTSASGTNGLMSYSGSIGVGYKF